MNGIDVRAARVEDMERLSAFMRHQGQTRCSSEYLRHWYFNSPSGDASVAVAELDGRIVGMSTIGHHMFERGTQRMLMGMPQQVLTDAGLRGRGIFGRSYRASEEDALQRGVHFFLTVTNAASTPIFLGKFGYVRLPSPRMALLPALPGRVDAVTVAADEAPARRVEPSAWSMCTDAAERRWRFAQVVADDHLVLRIGPATGPLGWAFARRVWKMGLPLLLIMELVPARSEALPKLLAGLRRLAWRQRTVGALLLPGPLAGAVRNAHPRLLRSSGFNLLVKGRDAGHTRALAAQSFGLSFGDLDFL